MEKWLVPNKRKFVKSEIERKWMDNVIYGVSTEGVPFKSEFGISCEPMEIADFADILTEFYNQDYNDWSIELFGTLAPELQEKVIEWLLEEGRVLTASLLVGTDEVISRIGWGELKLEDYTQDYLKEEEEI